MKFVLELDLDTVMTVTDLSMIVKVVGERVRHDAPTDLGPCSPQRVNNAMGYNIGTWRIAPGALFEDTPLPDTKR
jgi:hypothetical protein